MPEPTKTFDVDAFLAEADLVPFDLTVKGETYQLPHFNALPAEQALAVAVGVASDNVGTFKQLLVDIVDQRTADMLMGLPLVAFGEVLQRWQTHAGLEPGESEASSSS